MRVSIFTSIANINLTISTLLSIPSTSTLAPTELVPCLYAPYSKHIDIIDIYEFAGTSSRQLWMAGKTKYSGSSRFSWWMGMVQALWISTLSIRIPEVQMAICYYLSPGLTEESRVTDLC